MRSRVEGRELFLNWKQLLRRASDRRFGQQKAVMPGDASQVRDAADADTNRSGLSDAAHTAATHQQFASCLYTSGRSKWADFDRNNCRENVRTIVSTVRGVCQGRTRAQRTSKLLQTEWWCSLARCTNRGRAVERWHTPGRHLSRCWRRVPQ
jgi:hypothetical protein